MVCRLSIVGGKHLYGAAATAFEECRLDRFRDAGHLIVVAMTHDDAIHQQHGILVRLLVVAHRQEIVNTQHRTADSNTHEALLMQNFELGAQGTLVGHLQGGEEHHLRIFGEGVDEVHHIADTMALHLDTGDGRECTTNSGIEELQVLVSLSRRAHCGARIGGVDFLFDGDGRSHTKDIVHLGFAHATHELAGIAAQALHIASLPFGIERIERQRRLAAATQTGDDHQLVAWYADVNIFKIVDACALDDDIVVFVLLVHCCVCRLMIGVMLTASRHPCAELPIDENESKAFFIVPNP